MKIGLVCPYSIERHGGVQEVIMSLKSGFEAKGHSVKIITPRPRGSENINGDDPGYIFFGTSTDFKSMFHTVAQVSSTVDNEQVDAILASEKFDVLHFHEPWIPLLSRQLLQRSKAVNVATFHSKVHDAIMARTVIKVVTPYLKSVMSYIDEITAVSSSASDYVTGLTDKPITIIPNGIDLVKYHPRRPKKDPDEKIILFIGRLERRKGLRYLLRAFQVFYQDNPGTKLIIAGDGHERELMELMADDLKLHNVEFLGYISEEMKLELLAKADIFCSPAVYGESFGIVLLESMAMNTVVVAGNNSGYNEVMQGVGGISLVNPEDTIEFARRLNTLMHEVELRKVWQKWSKAYVKQFNYPIIVDQYEELYKDAIKQHHGRRKTKS
jgi:phosphatidylinositol alpha-mannosyltransferase